MIINEFSLVEIITFVRYQTFPIFLNLLLLSIWIPLVVGFFIWRKSSGDDSLVDKTSVKPKQDKSYLYLSLAFFSLFFKELILFFVARRFVFQYSIERIPFSYEDWILIECFFIYLFFFFTFRAIKSEVKDKGESVVIPLSIFEKERIFSSFGLVGFSVLILVTTLIQKIIPAIPLAFVTIGLASYVLVLIIYSNIFYLKIKKDYQYLGLSWFATTDQKKSIKSVVGLRFFIWAQFFLMVAIVAITFVDFKFEYRLNPEFTLQEFFQSYLHAIKVGLYLLLLFIVIQVFRKKVMFYEKSRLVRIKAIKDLDKLNHSLELKKLNFVPPKNLISSFLDFLLKKFNAEFVILDLGDETLLKINLKSEFYSFKSWHSDAPSIEEREIFFPYLERLLKERDKQFFLVDSKNQSEDFRRYFSYLTKPKNSQQAEEIVGVDSLLTIPIFKEDLNKTEQLGSYILINRMSPVDEEVVKAWQWDEAIPFLEIMFPTLVNLVQHYKVEYKEQLKKRQSLINRKMQEFQNDLIKKQEKVFQVNFPNKATDELGLASETFFPAKPRFNFSTYSFNRSQHRLLLTELDGDPFYLATINGMVRYLFKLNTQNKDTTVEKSYKKIQDMLNFSFPQFTYKLTELFFNKKKKTLDYLTTSNSPVVVFRYESEKLDLFSMGKSWSDDGLIGVNLNNLSEKTSSTSLLPLKPNKTGTSKPRNKVEGNIEKKFLSGQIKLKSKDLFFCGSGELLNLTNKSGGAFSLERLKRVLIKNKKENIDIINRRLREDLSEYDGDYLTSQQHYLLGKAL